MPRGPFPDVGSVEVTPPTANESPIRRCASSSDRLLTSPREGIDTVTDVLYYTAREHASRKAFGWRDILHTHVEEKEVQKTIGGKKITELRKWTYFELSGYKWINYIQMKEYALDLAKGLVELGMKPSEIFNIYAGTGLSWQYMQHACAAISVTLATAYATLGESGLQHSLNEPGCVAIFTNDDLLPTVLKVLPHTPSLKYIIYDGVPSPDLLQQLRQNGHVVLSQDEVRDLGRGKPSIEHLHPKSSDLCCIMYTSGSMGAPKGVLVTHSMVVSAISSVHHVLGHHLRLDHDLFLAFLPLAHSFEYAVELALCFLGCPIAYGRIKTLTDASVRNCVGDLKECAPTIMVGVPLIWETIRKGILGQVEKMPTLAKRAFHAALSVKMAGIPGLSAVADSLVLKKVKAQTGGRLRYVLSGSANLSTDTQKFMKAALVTILQGYGLTESCGMCTILPPEFFSFGTAGVPAPSVEIRLRDVSEAGYFANASPSRGEILMRGPSVTAGYYKRPDLNSDPTIFTEDGWFRTGDVGMWNSDGTLSIIDRIKNLVKLEGGEYVALEQLEVTYRTSSLVANICVHATSQAKQPIAIIFPHAANLKSAIRAAPPSSSSSSSSSSSPSSSSSSSFAWSGNGNGDGSLLPDPESDVHLLCSSPAVHDLVLKDLQALAKKAGLKGIEIVQGVVLTPDEWTAESGLLTAAQKVQRTAIERTFKEQISACYKASQG